VRFENKSLRPFPVVTQRSVSGGQANRL